MARREPIRDLERKLQFLCDSNKIPRGSLAGATGVNWEALDRAKDGKLGRGDQRKIGVRFRFPADDVKDTDGNVVVRRWHQWVDDLPAVGEPRDTALAFEDAYKAEVMRRRVEIEQGVDCTLGVNTAAVLTEQATAAPASRNTSDLLVGGQMREQYIPIRGFARILIEATEQADPAGGCAALLIEINCRDKVIPNTDWSYHLKRAHLVIDCGLARGKRGHIAGEKTRTLNIDDAQEPVTARFDGDMPCLEWELRASSEQLGHFYFDIGVIERLAHGDIIRAKLIVYRSEIETTDDQWRSPIGVRDDKTGRALEAEEEPYIMAQRRICEILQSLTLKPDGDGTVVVAGHEIELVRSNRCST